MPTVQSCSSVECISIAEPLLSSVWPLWVDVIGRKRERERDIERELERNRERELDTELEREN